MSEIRCTCGATTVATKTGITEIMRETGFGAVWDVSNGLSTIWLCSSCTQKLREHWLAIIAITKTETIDMSGFLKNTERLSS